MIDVTSLPMVATYFPVVVCLWFMFRMEKIIKANTEAMNNINSSLGNVYNNLNKEKRK